MQESAFEISQTIQGRPPRLPFERMKDAVLGKRYTLSLVFVGDARGRTLYRQYAGKDKPLNILAFPLSKEHGEIIINPRQAAREAKARGMSARAYIGYLFIHGLLHLKGYRHGATMEEQEEKMLRRFHL